MKNLIITAAIIFAAPLAIACDYPAPPKNLPDGSTAEIAEMKVGVKRIADYQNDMSTYLSCIEAEEVVAVLSLDEGDKDGKKQSKIMFDKKYNAAVQEQTASVEIFNAEIREFKDRPKD